MGRRTVQVPLHLEGISTPSDNPDIGYKYIYFKDDGILYCKDENGNEKIIGGGGGANSMVITFASGSTKHVTSTSGTYESLAHVIYAGSDNVGEINKFNINTWVSGGSTADVRLIDLNTGLTVVELLGINAMSEGNVQDMGTVTNLSTTPTVFEIQGRKTTGGGGAKLFIASLEMEY